ncbi:13858_t:CDS:2 [Cetraspora pellucida]|uniref:13858_t:CDS:1 n=1 Tax=Cetraspora pellucida TaxID=1433469 RepID=A0ACA9MYY5_9GLOM|nr:13858_t:CDS:2 [Cetraspora pellucida]
MPQNRSLGQLIADFTTVNTNWQIEKTRADAEKLRADTYERDILQEDNYQQERDNLQNKLDTHQQWCQRINCQEPCCLGDYKRLQNKLARQEKDILEKINNSLELGLKVEELTVQKIISRIEELIRGPKTTNQQLQKELDQAQKTIKLLQKDKKDIDFLAIQQTEYQKILAWAKGETNETCVRLGINIPFAIREKINQATTLVAVARERNNLIQAKLGENNTELKKIIRQKEKMSQEQIQER